MAFTKIPKPTRPNPASAITGHILASVLQQMFIPSAFIVTSSHFTDS
jgi:hypothetical protein